ncbi:MAG: lipocalin family protein [Flavobacteriaceae bacterium]|nr:lipocalin family protein [Flavobacteriaceae bacterium]
MKTFNKIFLISFLILLISCSNSDDDSGDPAQPTTAELLTSGKWYFESKTPGTYSSCEKKGYIQFMTNGAFTLVSYDDTTGTCESLGDNTGTYTLSNNLNINIVFGSDSQSAVINSISEGGLTLETDEETLVFDKTEG